MLIVATAVSASAVLLLPRIGTELVPEDDQSEFNVSVNLPRGTTLDRTAEYVKDIEPMLLATNQRSDGFHEHSAESGRTIWSA